MNRLTEGMRADDGRDLVRILAGILIGVGLLLVALRRGNPDIFGDNTSNFGLFVILGLAAGFLYVTGILGRALGGSDRRWQALYTVMGTLIMPFALYQLIATIDSSYDDNLAGILVFGASAAACVAAWLIARVRFQLLLASIYGAFAFLAFLDKILSDGLNSNLDTIRWLLLAFAVALVAAAFLVRRRATSSGDGNPTERGTYTPEDEAGSHSHSLERGGYADERDTRSGGRDAPSADLLTGAGLVALLAFSLGPVVALVLLSTFGALSLDGSSSPFDSGAIGQEAYWDVLTLLAGIALVVFGLGRGYRGPVYVGGAMLVLFLLSVGLDLDDSSPEGAIVGWPLIICVIGAGLFLLSLVPGVRLPLVGSAGGWFDGRGEREVDHARSGAGHEPAATAVAPARPPAAEPVAPPVEDEPPTRRIDPDPEPPTERLDDPSDEDRPPPTTPV